MTVLIEDVFPVGVTIEVPMPTRTKWTSTATYLLVAKPRRRSRASLASRITFLKGTSVEMGFGSTPPWLAAHSLDWSLLPTIASAYVEAL